MYKGVVAPDDMPLIVLRTFTPRVRKRKKKGSIVAAVPLGSPQ